jgi:hypothetical protein
MKTQTLSISHSTTRGGFALPAAIFALVVVAFLITGGIHLANQESRIGFASDRGTHAFYLAESGLQTVMAEWIPAASGLGEWAPDLTFTGTTPQGEWTANVTRVAEFLYVVRSTGSVDAGGGAQATRRVGQVARAFVLHFNPDGALTLPGGVHAAGAPTKVSGNDTTDPGFGAEWGALCPTAQNLPGLVTDDASVVTCSGGPPGCTQQYQGDPGVQQDSAAVVDQWQAINEQWDELVSYATHVVAPGTHTPLPAIETDDDGNEWCDTFPLLNWGNPREPGDPCAVGLDIGSGFVKLVEMDHSGDQPEVVRVAMRPLLPDAIVEGEIMDPGLVADTIRVSGTRPGSRRRMW